VLGFVVGLILKVVGHNVIMCVGSFANLDLVLLSFVVAETVIMLLPLMFGSDRRRKVATSKCGCGSAVALCISSLALSIKPLRSLILSPKLFFAVILALYTAVFCFWILDVDALSDFVVAVCALVLRRGCLRWFPCEWV
jgi:hypothetical protein